jgi:copper resistance protein C
MFKKVLLSFLLLITFASTVSAHTGLESSFPKNSEVVTEHVQEIVLSFETKIEQGSTFQVSAGNGLVVPIQDVTLNEKQMKGTPEQPLDNGEYLVHWEIIGADGHPIEGEFTFNVEVEQTEELKEEPIEKPVDEDKELEDHPNSTPPSSNEQTETENQEKSLPTSILVLILVLLIGILVWVFLMFFRRNKDS